MEALLPLIALIVVIGILIWRNLQGAPFYATNKEAIGEILSLVEWEGKRVAELGSGDGRLAIAIAQQGATVEGYEFNPLLSAISKRRIARAGLRKRVKIHRKNFWNVDLQEFDAVVIFGMPHIMGRLGTKLTRECKQGTPVVSHGFTFPNLQLVQRTHRALLYEVHRNTI